MATPDTPKKWEVDLHYQAIVTEEVMAVTEQEAIEKAIAENGRYLDDVKLTYTKAKALT